MVEETAPEVPEKKKKRVKRPSFSPKKVRAPYDPLMDDKDPHAESKRQRSYAFWPENTPYLTDLINEAGTMGLRVTALQVHRADIHPIRDAMRYGIYAPTGEIKCVRSSNAGNLLWYFDCVCWQTVNKPFPQDERRCLEAALAYFKRHYKEREVDWGQDSGLKKEI